MDAGGCSKTSSAAVFEDTTRTMVSSEHLRAATAADAVGGLQPRWIVEPGSEQELAKVLKLANEAGLAVIPRGGGTKLAWGNPPRRADVILSTARLNAVLEYAWSDLTVTVGAGRTMEQLRETLAPHGQRLALDPLWPSRATVGGVLSTNDSGVLRLRFGSLRDLIIGVTLALPDGTLAKSGGKVVKNVAGYDLPKLATGALGVCDAQRLLLAVQSSKLAHSALQVRFLESMQTQMDVLFEATPAGLTAQVEQLKAILAPSPVIDPGPAVWNARQELYSAAKGNESNSALAKLSVLPAQLAETRDTLAAIAANRVRFQAVVQGSGIGFVYLEAAPAEIGSTLRSLRAKLEAMGGSLMIAHCPSLIPPLEAWGNPGDALQLMHAVKSQFDPKSTLNPGRFVGGI
jgi:glycolate oxidase FAD binding subunit